jgi:hypothetical protein
MVMRTFQPSYSAFRENKTTWINFELKQPTKHSKESSLSQLELENGHLLPLMPKLSKFKAQAYAIHSSELY